MTGRTHLAAGIFTGEILAISTNQTEIAPIVFSVCMAAVGSLLPDIDHPSSMLTKSSRSTKMLSDSITAVTKHRGFTHTIVFVALAVALANYILLDKVSFSKLLVEALCAGMLSHLLLDTLNEKGIMWLWPFYRQPMHIACIRTGSKAEEVFRVFMNVCATVTLGYMIYMYSAPVVTKGVAYVNNLLQPR